VQKKERETMEDFTPKDDDVDEPGQAASGTVETGEGNNELESTKRHAGTSAALAERKTMLRGQSIDPVRKPKRIAGSRTESDLLAYDSDVPYAAVEKANLDLVCSLIERQDRVTERLLLMIIDLQYRVDDLESGNRCPVTKRSGTNKQVQ
jgi:hypothetical protein